MSSNSININIFKAGGKTKHKIEAEGGEIIQSNKPIEIKKGGVAIPLGNGYNLLKGRKHSQGGIDINMKGDGRVWSDVPFLNGKSPAKKVLDGENPNIVFNQQELFKRINKIKDDGSKARFGKIKENDNKKTFLDRADEFLAKAEPKITTTSALSALGSFAVLNPITPVISIGSNILGAGVDTYQLFRSITKKDKEGVKENLTDIGLDLIGAKAAKSIKTANALKKAGTAGKNTVIGLAAGAGRTQKITKSNDSEEKINIKSDSPIESISINPSYEEQLIKAKEFTKHYEGFSPTIYRDAGGIKTVGYGSTNPKHIEYVTKQGNVDEDTAFNWLSEEYDSVLNTLKEKIPNFNEYNSSQQFALTDLAFNIGINKLLYKSPKLMKAIKEKDYYNIATQIDHDMLDSKNAGATKRRIENRKPFWESYKGINEDEQFYHITDSKELHNAYKQWYREQQKQGKKEYGGNMNKNSLIYNLNGNVKQGLGFVPSTGKKPKAAFGMSLGAADWITAGANLLGSISSYFTNRKAIKNQEIPEGPSEPVAVQAAKLNTTYNINPQLSSIREAEARQFKDIDQNTTSSNVALARKQAARLNSLSQKNELYGQKENIENQLINQDVLNKQQVSAINAQNYNQHLTDTYKHKLAVIQMENEKAAQRAQNTNALINNLAGTVGDLLNSGKTNYLTSLLLKDELKNNNEDTNDDKKNKRNKLLKTLYGIG